ncbi:MAG: peptidylprolyl isomerase [Clostridia bacterium]|nr:peptidylprolyl isomerase [Clostridia bacterium]
MGKGNRSRQDRAFETVNTAVEATPKNTKLITTITTIAVSLLLVGCILLSVIVNTGIVLRTRTAAKTDNFSVSGTVMSYLIYSQAQQMVALYQQYGIDYTLADVLNSSFDSMAESTLDQVKQMLVLCEYAKANGIELSAEDNEAIDAYMASIDEAAASNFYSTASYIKLMYGNGVNASDIRKSLELNYLSNAAYEALEAKLEAEITEDAINKYVEENVDLFYMADYLTYTYTAELIEEGAEATVEETQAYEAEKAAMAALAEKLAAVKSADEFKSTAADHIVLTVCAEKFDELYEKEALTDAPAADVLAADKDALLALVRKSLTEDDVKFEKSADNAYNNALSEIFDELCDEAQTAYDAIVKEDSLHYDPEAEADTITELDTWLFDETTKVGDTKTITSEGDKKSTYSVYFMTATSHLDESATKDVAHILVSFDDYKTGTTITDEEKAKAKAEADKILADYLAGEKTQAAFEKLGEEKTADSNVVYEGVSKGDMVEEFENWIFDEARTVGETGIVETTYGYHVMYFIGDGKLAWENTAHSGVLNDLFTEWVETNATTYNYTAKESVVNSIK